MIICGHITSTGQPCQRTVGSTGQQCWSHAPGRVITTRPVLDLTLDELDAAITSAAAHINELRSVRNAMAALGVDSVQEFIRVKREALARLKEAIKSIDVLLALPQDELS